MGRILKSLLALAVLLWMGAATPAATEPVQVYNVAERVSDTLERIKAATQAATNHRFAPAYYAEPCSPTKEDGDRSLSSLRAQRRALALEVQQLKAQIRALETFSTNKVILQDNGWNWQNPQRFGPLDAALIRLNGAINGAEARLDAMPVLPCRPKTTPPTTPPAPQIDPGLLADDPLPPPTFDSPLTPPVLPEKFCSYGERNAFINTVYWPYQERVKTNAVKAIAHMTDLERRRNEIAYDEGSDSPRARAAGAAVAAWEPTRAARVQANSDALALLDRINAIPVVTCDTPADQTSGATGATGGGTTQPTAPATPATPLPDAVSRPFLAPVPGINLPSRFCSEKARLDFLVDVYHPRAQTASRNAVLASTYAFLLSDLASAALQDGQADLSRALQNERANYDPILKAAENEAQIYRDMRARILAIPVVACNDRERPPPIAQPTAPPTDAPPPTRPGLPMPDLTRPSLIDIKPLDLPRSFCSEFERNNYLNNVYNPTAAAALANAETTRAHLAKLQAMFTDYMRREGGPGWAAIRKELDAYKPIAEAAFAESTRISGLHKAILAIPVVPCDNEPAWNPVTPGPLLPTPAPTDDAGLEELIVRGTRLPSTPKPICDEAQRAAQQDAIRRARETADADARRVAERRALLEAAKAKGSPVASDEALEDLIVKGQRVEANQKAIDKAQADLDATRTDSCPPPADKPADPPRADPPATDGQTGARPALPEFKDFEELPWRNRFCTRAEAEAYLAQVERLLAEVEEERDRLEAFVGAVLSFGPMADGPFAGHDFRNAEDENFGLVAAAYSGGVSQGSIGYLAAAGRIYVVLGQAGLQRLRAYDALIGTLRAQRSDLIEMLDGGTFQPFDCPEPTDDAPNPPPADAPTAPPADSPDGPKKPCPPKQGRDPIIVGPNSKVGSGAQLRSKVTGMATGALLGALGVGGGGGGGGSDGPDLWTCKIKDSEYTVFNDPVTGVSLGVAARTVKGGKMVLFSKIMKSPDKGTFQTAFLERPSTGQTIAPSDVGPCDLWGEWKLTVSWTKTTYVNGQVVDRQSGGWSEGGLFRIPGMLSKVDAPDGLWKRMGFSNASNGAREMGAIFDVQPSGEPLTLVVHVTRPKGDPVTTVPFVLTLTQGPDGKIAVTKAEEEPCPPEETVRVDSLVLDSPPAMGGTEEVTGGFAVAGTLDYGLDDPPSGRAKDDSDGVEIGSQPSTPEGSGATQPPPPAPSSPGTTRSADPVTQPAGSEAQPTPGAARPRSTENDDLFLPKPEVTYFRPNGSDGPRFANYRQIADALGARKPCTREEAQRLLEEVNGALAAEGEAIDDLTVYAGASGAQAAGAGSAPGDLYGPDRPTGRTTSTEDGREATSGAFEAEAVRVRRAAGDEGEKAFRDMDFVQSELRRLKRNLERSIETDDFDDCPAEAPPPPPPPPPPIEVMPTPTAGPGDLPGPAPDGVKAPSEPPTTPTEPGAARPRSTENDDLFLSKPEVTYLQPKGPDGPRFANYFSVAEALRRRAPCTKAEAESLLREVESALSAQADAVDELGVYAGASGAQPGEGWWRKSSPGTSLADGYAASYLQFELEAARVRKATGIEGYEAFQEMTDALKILQGLKHKLETEITTSKFDSCPGVAPPPPGDAAPNPTAGPGDLPLPPERS